MKKSKMVAILVGILVLCACTKGESAANTPETNTSETNISNSNTSESNISESNTAESQDEQKQTTFVQDEANIVCAWISAAEPHDSLGLMYDPSILKFGMDTEGEPTVSLLRFALPADILDDEVQEARLVLKSAESMVLL